MYRETYRKIKAQQHIDRGGMCRLSLSVLAFCLNQPGKMSLRRSSSRSISSACCLPVSILLSSLPSSKANGQCCAQKEHHVGGTERQRDEMQSELYLPDKCQRGGVAGGDVGNKHKTAYLPGDVVASVAQKSFYQRHGRGRGNENSFISSGS